MTFLFLSFAGRSARFPQALCSRRRQFDTELHFILRKTICLCLQRFCAKLAQLGRCHLCAGCFCQPAR